jgi:hypothetical protein
MDSAQIAKVEAAIVNLAELAATDPSNELAARAELLGRTLLHVASADAVRQLDSDQGSSIGARKLGLA